MHKLHDPFNSLHPSDPNCNSPFTPPLPPPHHPGPLHAAFSPLRSMRVLSLTSSNRNSPSPCLSFYKEIRTQRCCQGWSCVRRTRRNVGNYELNTHFARIAKALPKPSFVWCTTRRDRLVHQFSWYPFCSSFSISCIHSTASRAISPIRIDKARKESPVGHGLCDLLVFWHVPPQHHNYQPEGQTLC